MPLRCLFQLEVALVGPVAPHACNHVLFHLTVNDVPNGVTLPALRLNDDFHVNASALRVEPGVLQIKAVISNSDTPRQGFTISFQRYLNRGSEQSPRTVFTGPHARGI